jgi:hypothetical protein
MAVEKEHRPRNIKSWTRPFARQTISPKNLDKQKKKNVTNVTPTFLPF